MRIPLLRSSRCDLPSRKGARRIVNSSAVRRTACRWLGACVLLGSALAPIESAVAQTSQVEPQQRLERPRADALADLPADVDLVIVVHNGSALRASTLGRRAERWLADQGVLERLEPAGKALGSELGWSRDELFDRLLGQRAVLVLRGSAGFFAEQPIARGTVSPPRGDPRANDRRQAGSEPGAAQAPEPAAGRWALMSRVTRADERRVRERLAIAPRAMIDGQQVLSLERGRYELATRAARDDDTLQRAGQPATASRDQDLVEMVLGPVDPALIAPSTRGDATLFEQLVRTPEWPENIGTQATARPPSRLAETRAFDCAAAFPTADIVVMWRVRAPGASRETSASDWSRFFVLSAWRETEDSAAPNAKPAEERWTIRTTYADPERASELAALRGFSLRSFERLAAGACGAMLQATALNDLLTPSLPVADLVRQLQMPEAAVALIGQEQALRLESIPARVDETDAARGTKGARSDRPRLAVGAAVGVSSVADAAPAFDRAITQFISSIESARGRNVSSSGVREDAASDPWMPLDLAGLAPAAVRVVPVMFTEPRPDVLLAGGALTFSWAYAVQDGHASPPRQPGWWCVGLTPNADGSSVTDARPRQNTAAIGAGAALRDAPPDASDPALVRNQLSAGDADPAGLVRRTLEPLTDARAECGQKPGGWLWLVSLKPIELERSLPAIWPDYRGIRSAMQGVTSFSARLRAKPAPPALNQAATKISGTRTKSGVESDEVGGAGAGAEGGGGGEIEGWASFTLPPMKE